MVCRDGLFLLERLEVKGWTLSDIRGLLGDDDRRRVWIILASNLSQLHDGLC